MRVFILPAALAVCLALFFAGCADLKDPASGPDPAGDVRQPSQQRVSELLPAEKPANKRGAILYRDACAGCHGASGDGIGPVTSYIHFEPTSFRDASFREKADLNKVFQSIYHGSSADLMPAFSTRYSTQDIWNISSYLFSFGTSTERLKRGKIVYEKHCLSCHGVAGDSLGGIMQAGKINVSFTDQRPISLRSRAEYTEVVQAGAGERGMPSFSDVISTEDVASVVEYVFLFSYQP